MEEVGAAPRVALCVAQCFNPLIRCFIRCYPSFAQFAPIGIQQVAGPIGIFAPLVIATRVYTPPSGKNAVEFEKRTQKESPSGLGLRNPVLHEKNTNTLFLLLNAISSQAALIVNHLITNHFFHASHLYI